MISLKPWMPVRAVLNSWLTIEMNSLFSRFSRSSSSSEAIAAASAACLALMSSNMARK